jgi:hypothetical protein
MKVTVTEKEDKPLKLEVGKTYLDRHGKKNKIIYFNKKRDVYLDEDGCSYKENGVFKPEVRSFDLIKEVAEEPSQQEIEYPCLMKCEDNEIIYLLINSYEGVCLTEDEFRGFKLGEKIFFTDSYNHTPFTGKITLENE